MSTQPRRLAALASAALAVAGLTVLGPSAHAADPVEIQILGTNDFHGRLANETGSTAAGAAVLAGAVKQLREANPNTIFAAAGDLIGASTFDSFIQRDKPTIDALNEAGLDVSSVGNHEFDKGFSDLVDRVMAPYDEEDNPLGGAEWQYIGANVRYKADDTHALEPSWTTDVAGVTIGFIGAVTEELPSLVTPAGIADLKITNIVNEVNAEADALTTAGADLVVLLVHEGGTICDSIDNVDAIISGHTHQLYDCNVDGMPVVSSGQYGSNLNQLTFTVDPDTGEVLSQTQAVLKLKNTNAGPPNYTPDPATEQIVADALAQGQVLGAQKLGEIAGTFSRAVFDDGSENRGGESTLGNLVAEVQRWATSTPERGAAEIAFMNPGGLRADMLGTGTGPFPRELTYRQAANVQSFANTLVNMNLTGAQIKEVLEQQKQPAAASRQFLRLGVSKGFKYTYDPATFEVTHMWLNGEPIDLEETYSVTVNSFLASGGDNFFTLAEGTDKRDTGMVDLEAMVAYMAEFANTEEGDDPLAPDFEQQAVGVHFPDDAPAAYEPGFDPVRFDLTSLSMTEPGATRDDEVTVKLDGDTLGTFPVETVLTTPDGKTTTGNTNDESGTASVDVLLPSPTPEGPATLVIEGAATGTSVEVPIQVSKERAPTGVDGDVDQFNYGKEGLLTIALTRDNADGDVEVYDADDNLIGTASLTDGRGSLELPAKMFTPGLHDLRLEYLGTDTFRPSSGVVTFRVLKPAPKVKANAPEKVKKKNFKGTKVRVRIVAPDDIPAQGKVKVTIKGTGKSVTGKLVDGKVVIKLPKVASVGKYTLKVKYLGSALLHSASTQVTIKVVK